MGGTGTGLSGSGTGVCGPSTGVGSAVRHGFNPIAFVLGMYSTLSLEHAFEIFSLKRYTYAIILCFSFDGG